MLGYRGHFLTKSRRYSVTFTRCARPASPTAASNGTPTARKTPGAATSTNAPSCWQPAGSYAGTGHATTAERQLALAAAARAREHDRIAREETWTN